MTKDFSELLRVAATAVGISLTEEQIAGCAQYSDLLRAANEQMNLTRITAPDAVAIKHFADSLTVLGATRIKRDAHLADVGTGAGFPGIVLAIVRPDLHVTLIDSVNKRLVFLQQIVTALSLPGVRLVHGRAEDLGRRPEFRDQFDVVVARAVARLPVLIEWCAPLVRPGTGRFVAMKSAGVDEELQAARPAAQALQLTRENDKALTLPATESDTEPAVRRLIVYRKTAPTPARYPRLPAEIKKQPLGESSGSVQ